jgi:hypothetical protein
MRADKPDVGGSSEKNRQEMKRALIIYCLVIFTPYLFAQQTFSDIEQELERQFDRLRERISSQQKLELNDSIVKTIDKYTKSEMAFRHEFKNLKYLGQITSPDSLVKIVTWNLILDDGTNYYHCYLLQRDSISESYSVIKLGATHSGTPIRTDTTYSASDWYGSLYYDLRPFINNGETRYAILGIDYGNSLTTRKIIDVVSFTSDGGIMLGLPCFTNGSETSSRVVFEYASSAVMSLKFESDQKIVSDHLSPFTPEMKGNYQFYGPDFSFDSYDYEKGYWKLNSDIDIRNKD